MDSYLFNLINQYALKWDFLDAIGIALAEYLGYALILIIVIFVIVNSKRYLKMAVETIVAGAFARFGIVFAIRWIWERPRPFINNNVNLLLEHNAFSFPSGHAAFFFAISTIVYYYNKRIGILFFLSSILIVIARVFSGIHWPSDILVGVLVGIFSGWLIHKILK